MFKFVSYIVNFFIISVEYMMREAKDAVCKNVYLAARIIAMTKERPNISAEEVSSVAVVLIIECGISCCNDTGKIRALLKT